MSACPQGKNALRHDGHVPSAWQPHWGSAKTRGWARNPRPGHRASSCSIAATTRGRLRGHGTQPPSLPVSATGRLGRAASAGVKATRRVGPVPQARTPVAFAPKRIPSAPASTRQSAARKRSACRYRCAASTLCSGDAYDGISIPARAWQVLPRALRTTRARRRKQHKVLDRQRWANEAPRCESSGCAHAGVATALPTVPNTASATRLAAGSI